MSAFFVLVIVSIVVAGGFLGAFIWSVKTDQYEDRKGAAMRMLYDDEIQKNLFIKYCPGYKITRRFIIYTTFHAEIGFTTLFQRIEHKLLNCFGIDNHMMSNCYVKFVQQI